MKTVETQIVKKSSIQHKISLIGTITPKQSCVLTSKIKGVINVLAKPGTSLNKGDLIATIDNPEICKVYDLALSTEHIAKSQYERCLKLAKSKASSEESLENKRRILIESQKNLIKAKEDKENTFIRAPFNGILGIYKIKNREFVFKNTQVAFFYNGFELFIEFEIPSKYIRKIDINQKAIVNGKILKLTHVQKALDKESLMCPARIELTNNDMNLIIGESIDIDLVIEEKLNTIVIPYSSVFIKNGKNMVYVVKDNIVEIREVKLGIIDKDKVEILDWLKESEEIITAGQDRLRNGMRVNTLR